MSDREFGVKTSLDITDIREGLNSIVSLLGQLPERFKTDIEAKVSGIENVQNLQATLEELSSEKVTPTVDLDGDAESKAEELQAKLDDWDSRSAQATADLEDQASSKEDEILQKLDEMDGRVAEVIAQLDDQASPGLDELSGKAAELDGSTITIGVEAEDTSQKTSSGDSLLDLIIGGGVGIIGGISGVSLYSDSQAVERSSRNMADYWGVTAQEASNVQQRARDLADQLAAPGLNQPQIMGGFERLSQLNVPYGESMSEMPHWTSMAKRNQMELNDVINLGIPIIRSWNLSGEEANEKLDDLNIAMQRSVLGGQAYENLFGKMASSMTGWDIAPEELMGTLTAMEEGGATAQQLQMAFRRPQTTLKEFKENLDGSGASAKEAKKAMDELGVSVVKNADGTTNYGKTFEAVVEALGGIEDPTKRADLATKIFGDNAGSVFAKIRGKPSEYASEMEESSNHLSQDLARNAKDTRNWQEQLAAAYNYILSEFMKLPPAVQAGVSLMMGALTTLAALKLKNFFTDLFKDPKAAFNDFINDLKSGPEKVSKFYEDIKTKTKSFVDWFKGEETKSPKVTDLIFDEKTGRYEAEENKVKGFIERVKNKVNELRGKNIPETLFEGEDTKIVDSESKINSLIDRVKGKAESLKDANVYKFLFGEEAGAEEKVSKINSFLDDVKGRTNELRDSNIYKLIFGDEQSTPVEEAKGKFGKFIDDIKVRVDELRGYNIIDRIFGTPAEGETRIGNARSSIYKLIDDVKLKIDELKGYNILEKVTGTGGGTGTGTGDKVKLPEVETGGIIDKIKSFSLKEAFSGLFQGARTSWTLGARSFSMWAGTELIDFLKPAVSLGGADVPALMGLFEPGGVFYELEHQGGASEEDLANPWKALDDLLLGYARESPEWQQNVWKPLDDAKQKISEFTSWINKPENKPPTIMDLLFPKAVSGAGGGEKKSPVDDIKTEVQKFPEWINGLKIPSITDLLFGKKDGEGEEDPVTKTTNEIKGKINKFFEDLSKLNPINLIDLLLGKKSGQKQEGQEEDPINKWIEDTKSKVNKFFEDLDKLNPFSLIDLILGKKKDQKDEEDPLAKWIEDSKTKINKFFEDLSKLTNPISLVDLVLGRKAGQKEDEDPLQKWFDDTKGKVNKFFEDLQNLNPINLIDKILGRKPGEEDPLTKWLDDAKKKLDEFISTVEGTAQRWYETGKQLIDNFLKGMGEAWDNAPPILKNIADYLFKSPAKTGPLSEITEIGWANYGAALGKSFVNGLYDSIRGTLPYLTESGFWNYIANSSGGPQGVWDLSNRSSELTREPSVTLGDNHPDSLFPALNWEDFGGNIDMSISGLNDLQSQLEGSNSELGGLTQSANNASAALADVTSNSAHAALGGVNLLGDSSAKAALGWVEATDTVKAALGGINAESAGKPELANIVSGTPLQGRPALYIPEYYADTKKALAGLERPIHAGLGGVTNINVNVGENAVKVDATNTKAKAGLGGSAMKKAGSGLGKAIAEEIGVSVKNQGITITRW